MALYVKKMALRCLEYISSVSLLSLHFTIKVIKAPIDLVKKLNNCTLTIPQLDVLSFLYHCVA